MKRAIILAAGIGKRLGELTKHLPKCLLPIEFEDTLLDISIRTLVDNKILEISIVSGFGSEILKKHIAKKWGNKISVKYIFNEYYKEYNNIYSAYLARTIWDDETILFNSDIIYHPLILKNLIEEIKKTNKQKSFLVIDDTKKLTEESMKVIVDSSGEIKQINKALEINSSLGEYIGITYLRGLEREQFLQSLEKNVKNKKLDIYYEDAIADVLSEVSVFPFSTSAKSWTEIDTAEDYRIAKQISEEIKNELNQYSR